MYLALMKEINKKKGGGEGRRGKKIKRKIRKEGGRKIKL